MLLRTDTAVDHRIGMSILGSPDNGTMIFLSYWIHTECSKDDNNLVNVTPPFHTGIACSELTVQSYIQFECEYLNQLTMQSEFVYHVV